MEEEVNLLPNNVPCVQPRVATAKERPREREREGQKPSKRKRQANTAPELGTLGERKAGIPIKEAGTQK